MPGKLPIGTFFDDLADAIANPSPSRPLRDAVGRQGRKVCDALSNVPPWARTVPGAVRDLAGICAPYWDEQGISAPVSQGPGFTGGQCPTPYRVRLFIGNNELVVGGVVPVTFDGPLGSLSRTIGPPSGGQFPTFNVTWAFSSNPVVKRFTVNLNQAQINISSVRVAPLDGSPDDCGDAPTEIVPGPNPAPNPPTIPPEEQPIDDPVSGPLLPIPDLPGLPGFPDIPWRNPFAPGKPDTGIPGDPGTPGDPEDTVGGGDDAEGEAEPGSELVALKLDLLQVPAFVEPLKGGVYRAACFVYMGTVAGLDQDPAGALVRSGQLVYAERSGLTKWRVSANVGFNIRVTPFYQETN